MASLTNTPTQSTLLTLAARKSFSFTVQFLDSNGEPLTLDEDTGVSFTIGEQSYSATPVLTQQASTIVPVTAIALFNLQASQLDLVPGIYPFEIVTSVVGYSSVAINGELEIVESYEMGSLGQTYDEAPSSFGLIAHMKHNRLIVSSSSVVLEGPEGPQGPPGVDGDPFDAVVITYNEDDRIASLTIGGRTTSYTYNEDGTIAFDERDGVQREYIYTDDMLTSIEPS